MLRSTGPKSLLAVDNSRFIVYRMFMLKKALSVTLRNDNLLWLKGRTKATGSRSVSETLDTLVSAARAGGPSHPGTSRSVVGTIDVAADDPNLEKADAHIKDLFAVSLAQPVLVREQAASYSTRKPRKPVKRRG